jgi:hypothetical protein
MDVGIQGGLDGWKKYKVDMDWMDGKNTRWIWIGWMEKIQGGYGLDGLDGWMDVRVDVSVFALRLSQICKVRKARSC